MERKRGHKWSLKWSVLAIVGMCWALPVLLILLISNYYVRNNLHNRIQDTILTSVDNAVVLTLSNINAALASSRAASYDGTVREAWQAYTKDGDDVALYHAVTSYLSQKYSYDENFRSVMLFFSEQPDTVFFTTNRASAQKSDSLYNYKAYAHETVLATYQTQDTDIYFFRTEDGALYFMRNIMTNDFQPYAVIIMECNEASFFAPLHNIVWMTDATVTLDGIPCKVMGDIEEAGRADTVDYQQDTQTFTVSRVRAVRDFTLRLHLRSDGAQITNELPDFSGIMVLLIALAVPLLLFVIWAFYHYVTRPLETIIDASARVASGERGYTVSPLPESFEFSSLAERFNSMSTELKAQFERSYAEQLALQDARIKALQSQINPHFLNNTLEIINWEARMANNERVCRMIEALSTMLDAAMARGGMPTVCLQEELAYMDAYLYIVSERYGERLTIQKEIDETLMDAEVPRLILQPIVENAIEHGIEQHASGMLTIRAYRREKALYLEVENDGSMSEDDRNAIARLLAWDGAAEDLGKTSSGRIGIGNVNLRLKILYGESGGLTIEEVSATRVLAQLVLPEMELRN